MLKTGPATDLVMVPIGSPIVNVLSRGTGWLPLYRDTYCIIFARDGLPGLDRIVRTPVPFLPDNGDRLCVPAPASGRTRPRSRDAAGGVP